MTLGIAVRIHSVAVAAAVAVVRNRSTELCRISFCAACPLDCRSHSLPRHLKSGKRQATILVSLSVCFWRDPGL